MLYLLSGFYTNYTLAQRMARLPINANALIIVRLLLVCLFCMPVLSWGGHAQALAPHSFFDTIGDSDESRKITLWTDPEHKYDQSHVTILELKDTLKAYEHFRIDGNQLHYFLVRIKTGLELSHHDWVLSIDHPYPMFDKVVLIKNPGEFNEEIVEVGQNQIISDRDIATRSMAFGVYLSPYREYNFILGVQSTQPQNVSLTLKTKHEYMSYIATTEYIWGSFLSLFLVATLYSFITFLFTRKRMYFHHMLFSLLAFLFQISLSGHGLVFLWPSSPEFNDYSNLLFLGLLQISAILFTRDFLKIRHFYPYIYKLTNYFIFTIGLLTLISMFESYPLGSSIQDFLTSVTSLVVACLSIISVRKPVVGAFIFVIGFLFVLVCSAVFMAMKYNLIGGNMLTFLAPQLGFLSEIAMFTAAISFRVRRTYLERDTLLAQQEKTINKLSIAEESLQRQAMYDRTTSLPNKNLLANSIQDIISKQHTQPMFDSEQCFLVVVEIRNLKSVNSNLGHYHGEQLTIFVASQLHMAIEYCADEYTIFFDEKGTSLCVIDDDHFGFMVHLDNGDNVHENLEELLNEILLSVPNMVKFDTLNMEIDLKCGACPIIPNSGDADLYLCNASIALEQGISYSRRYYLYDAAFGNKKKAELEMIHDLREALDSDQIVVYMQPQLDIHQNKVVAAEALVRWQHPTKGMIFPDQFIPLAEKAGLIQGLTRCVIKESLRQLKALHNLGYFISVSVNISAKDISEDGLTTFIIEALEDVNMPQHYLTLELTETDVVVNVDLAKDMIAQWNSMNLCTSLDDFGTGYSSLFQLKEYPMRELKIDRSFVMDLEKNESLIAIVRSVIEMGHNLGMTIVAEGVENPEILGILKGLNCDVIQGYMLSRPIPEQEMVAWLGSTEYSVEQSQRLS